ncbi:restriction endonuclease subunit S [Limosilactobacillus reuteri]|uniref:restriction endonuclease subunit S n=2 Tax=Limosilactobacillus reuteri TaxID=1598 RepID=UPI00143DDCBE|nr:restriction endonuclease subunit S [Limosilactobacillus reuteri]MCC4398286.1 restriction endonuclease subunit S [Limosilactobacillus reuteri]QIZ04313.1 restriction endonuclease subunit S [Limosilactobacillus reuteri]
MDKKPEKLVPEVRFKGFTDDWEQRKLGEISKRVRNNDGRMNLPLLTISARYGWMTQQSRFSASIAGREKKNYTLLKKHQLSYNHGNSKVANYGTVYELTDYDEALVPKVYHSFSLTSENSSKFIESYFHTKKLDAQLRKFIASTARMDGLLNISFDDFMKVKLFAPERCEQSKISRIINLIEKLITLQQRKLEQLRQLKIFTLQRMFIDKDCKQPILRFKNFNDNWLPHKFNDIANTFSGGTPAISNKDYYGGNIPFIRSAEINKNTTQLHLTPDGLKNSSAKFIKKGTLLYALYGATSGEVGIAQIDGAINQAVMAINLKKDNVYFIKTWLIKNKRKIISTYLQGGQGNLSAKIVKHLKLSLPKIEEEKLISITIMKIDSLIKLQQSKIDDLVNLKKYLLQKLFI